MRAVLFVGPRKIELVDDAPRPEPAEAFEMYTDPAQAKDSLKLTLLL